nr:hypothetical protein [Paenibacillus bovis]
MNVVEHNNEFCYYCGKRAELYPVKAWNKDEYSYFCNEHVNEARSVQRHQSRRFVEY